MCSNSNNNSSASGGIGFCGLLAIVFITLKLLGGNHMELVMGSFSYMDSNSTCNCGVACDFGYPFNQKL